MKHTIVDSNGNVTGTFSGPENHKEVNSSGRTIVEGEAPSPLHTWDGKQWNAPTPASTLAAAKHAKIKELKKAHTTADEAGFFVDGHNFPSDKASQAHISSVAASAQSAVTANDAKWQTVWTLVDESTINLTAPQMVHVGHVLNMFLGGHHQLFQHLKGLVTTAVTPDDVARVVWTPAEKIHEALAKAVPPTLPPKT